MGNNLVSFTDPTGMDWHGSWVSAYGTTWFAGWYWKEDSISEELWDYYLSLMGDNSIPEGYPGVYSPVKSGIGGGGSNPNNNNTNTTQQGDNTTDNTNTDNGTSLREIVTSSGVYYGSQFLGHSACIVLDVLFLPAGIIGHGLLLFWEYKTYIEISKGYLNPTL